MDQSESSPQSILSDRVTVNGTVTQLTLTADGKLRWTDRGQRCLTIEKEVLGFVIEGARIRIKAVVDSEDSIFCAGSKGTLVRKDFVFHPLNEDQQRIWFQHLRDYLDSLGRPKRLFVFVNPFGGKKSASKVFRDVVKPLLEDADVQITVQGTGNGMAKSLLDSVGEPCEASNAILAVIRGHKRSLDVAAILQGETKFFSVLMLSWGLVADIDIESEKYRWMGTARLDFYAIQRIIHLRKYNGRISFVPAPGFESYGEPSNYNGETTGKQSISISSQEQPVKIDQHGYQGPDVDLINLEWRTISGPFVSIWLHNVPWGGEDVMAAPDAKFSDGYLDLILIGECPKLSLLTLLSELKTGGHVKSPYVIYLKVKAFVLEPGPRADEPMKEGIIDVDGEVLARGNGSYKCERPTLMAYDKLQITVDPGLATLFTPV
ncbi:sphingosine kinase 1 isoform X2 [Manihot esculenta]|uniref:sphingosine kinase 1 isoform X2 n=1 Tax=Manihot esculenta TaxID=3983 RepID=UPI001CC5F2CD|nr:sphingosine kinase 1 isoform X2 [Manihot esculenta]